MTQLAALLTVTGLCFAPPSSMLARPTEARPLLVGNWADPTVLKDGDDYCFHYRTLDE